MTSMRMLIAALALACPLVSHAGLDEALQAYQQGDYATAMPEFKRLAEQGDVKAEFYMGFFYLHGYGVAPDYAQAQGWFKRAAATNDPTSLFYLGKMAEAGQGGKKDPVAAHMWLSLSEKNSASSRDAAYTHDDIVKLEKKMTPEQIAKAKEMAAQWKPAK